MCLTIEAVASSIEFDENKEVFSFCFEYYECFEEQPHPDLYGVLLDMTGKKIRRNDKEELLKKRTQRELLQAQMFTKKVGSGKLKSKIMVNPDAEEEGNSCQ